MTFRKHQTYVFNKLLIHNKSFIFWPRQTGKSYLLSFIIEQFVNNNNNKDILFIIDDKNNINISKSRIINDIFSSIKKIRINELELVNDNYITFCPLDKNMNYTLHMLSPLLIIYDEFFIYNLDKLSGLNNYISTHNCKCIFTSTSIDLNVVSLLDHNDDFYINIIPYPRLDLKHLLKTLSYKKSELLDYFDLSFIRKIKIEALNYIQKFK